MTKQIKIIARVNVRGRIYGGMRKVLLPVGNDFVTSLIRKKLIIDTQKAIRETVKLKYAKRHARRSV